MTAALTHDVRQLLARGLTPEELLAARRRIGFEASPEVVVDHLRGHQGMQLALTVEPGAADLEGGAAQTSDPSGREDPRTVLVVGNAMPPLLSQTFSQGGPLWVRWYGVAPATGVCVGVVGTRRATLDGVQLAERLGRDLATAGVTVVSGLARGIDQAAHRGALAAGGPTIAVLGTGRDVDYPSNATGLRARIQASGGVVTEYAPDRGITHKTQFIARNRILAGLCSAVVVVEAGARSGALNTARWAMEANRDVMAMPASPTSTAAAGSLELLADGATMVRDADDVLAGLATVGAVVAGAVVAGAVVEGAARGRDASPAAPGGDVGSAALDAVLARDDLRRAARAVLTLVGSQGASPSGLAAATGLPVADVMAIIGAGLQAGVLRQTREGVVLERGVGRGVRPSGAESSRP